ncbi:MAG: gliding motility-associated C-terminal domain-containing protein, partial [Bacteroidota bacterium]
VFYAFGTNIADFNLQVYNRWGDLVFATNDPSIGWDGTVEDEEATQDVYVYKADYKTIKNTTEVKTGRLTLVR